MKNAPNISKNDNANTCQNTYYQCFYKEAYENYLSSHTQNKDHRKKLHFTLNGLIIV